MKEYVSKTFYCYRDGLRISGTQWIPFGKKRPILIISHGFMANQKTVQKYAKVFVRKGYACFTFDFNGGGIKSKSQGKTTDMTVFTEVEDLKAVIAYAQGLPDTDSSRVILMGCSQGGFVSAITAAELGKQIEKLILFYPALCIPDDARKGQMMFAKFDPENIPETMKCGPMLLGRDYAQSVLNMAEIEQISAYEGPVLIVHGTKDPVVPIAYAEKAHKAYKDSCLVKIFDGGHGFRGSKDGSAIKAVYLFLKGKREMLCVDVKLTGVKRKKEPDCMHVSIPFTGHAEGDFFTGTIGKGATDEQRYYKDGSRLLCASYDIYGEDYTGEACMVHVINQDSGNGWKPEVFTDSAALQDWNQKKMYDIVEQRKTGPVVHIFG